MSIIDTPDGQYGVVSAQLLLGNFPGSTLSATVGVPPNTETLIVVMPSQFEPVGVTVIGNTTGMQYPGVFATAQPGIFSSVNVFFDVTSQLDETVFIEIAAVIAGRWYVYSDAGVHITADVSKISNSQGVQYVIPTAPGLVAGDHPPSELSFFSAIMSANGVFLSAPSAGQRYRMFGAQMVSLTGSLTAILNDGATGRAFLLGSSTAPAAQTFMPSGLPISIATPVDFTIEGGAGSMMLSAFFTTETA